MSERGRGGGYKGGRGPCKGGGGPYKGGGGPYKGGGGGGGKPPDGGGGGDISYLDCLEKATGLIKNPDQTLLNECYTKFRDEKHPVQGFISNDEFSHIIFMMLLIYLRLFGWTYAFKLFAFNPAQKKNGERKCGALLVRDTDIPKSGTGQNKHGKLPDGIFRGFGRLQTLGKIVDDIRRDILSLTPETTCIGVNNYLNAEMSLINKDEPPKYPLILQFGFQPQLTGPGSRKTGCLFGVRIPNQEVLYETLKGKPLDVLNNSLSQMVADQMMLMLLALNPVDLAEEAEATEAAATEAAALATAEAAALAAEALASERVAALATAEAAAAAALARAEALDRQNIDLQLLLIAATEPVPITYSNGVTASMTPQELASIYNSSRCLDCNNLDTECQCLPYLPPPPFL